MTSKLSQQGRICRLATTLGEDALLMVRIHGRDFVNDLFEYDVEAISADGHLPVQDLPGTTANVTLDTPYGVREMNGIITRAEWSGANAQGHLYKLTMRPWFWLCGKRRNNRIFHNKSVTEIIQAVLADWSGASSPHLEMLLTKSYPPLEYTVQYGESDLQFLRRQMERFGISFHFAHRDGAHVLVLTDDAGAFQPLPGGTRPYYPVGEGHNYEDEHFFHWSGGHSLTTGAVRLTDYNFKTPRAAMAVDRAGSASHPWATIESFDYPGDFLDQGSGRGVNNLRLDQEQSAGAHNLARGNVAGLAAGLTVTPQGQAGVAIDGQAFVCTASRFTYSDNEYGTGGTMDNEWSFSAEYDLAPVSQPFVPARVTPVPRIFGPQTAMVVGQGEIDCDEYGRILVRFHWDLEGANSMRCRVVQHTASAEYGGMAIPRIGMEAVVEFLEGDPDKPLVTGCVFNGKTDRPYKLPDHKTKHVIRADSHQGQGFNEISFEADAGRENMAIHAQKDQTIRVLNDQSSNISANRLENIGANATLAVAANQMERVGANKSVTVGGNGAGVLQMLMPLVAAGGKFLGKGAKRAGSGGGTVDFSGLVGGVADMPRELAAIAMNGSFGGSGGHRDAGGAAQHGSAAQLARLIRGIMPGAGVLSTTVQRFNNLSVGEAATEQVGDAKNTTVGRVMTTSVGQLMLTKVGEDIDIEAKKSIFARTTRHTLHAKEKFIIGGPGGTIVIDDQGITIKARRLVIKSPSVDFMSGSPDQVDALASDKPFAQECKGE